MPHSLQGASSHPWLPGWGGFRLQPQRLWWGGRSCPVTTLALPPLHPRAGASWLPPDVMPKGPWGRLSLLLCPPRPRHPSPLCDPTENPGDRGRDPALQQGQVLQREVHEDHLVPQVGWPCPGVPGGRGPAPTPEPSCPPTPGPQREPRKGTAVRGTEGRLWDPWC